jgi:glycosyltransferase involved in cell wall biosynthesis
MKILLVNKYYYLRGGSEKYFFELENLLRKKGHQVHIFSMKDEKNQYCSDEGYFIKNISFRKKREIKNIFYRQESVRKLEELIKDFRPDLVHLNNINFQLTASVIDYLDKQNIPIVMTLHDYQLICPNNLLYIKGHYCQKCLKGNYLHCFLNKCWNNSFLFSLAATMESYYNHFNKIYYNKINFFISPSQFLKTKMIEAGFNGEKIKVFPNFLNLKQYQYWNFLEKEDYYLYAGRLTESKGVNELIDFFIKNPDYRLKIAGRGELIRKEKTGNIEYLGYLPNEELKQIIAKAKALIIPSKWPENCPYSVLESFALGTLVIAKNFAGLKELVINGENGFLYNNYQELADIITRVEGDISLGNKAKEHSKKYNSEDYYQRLMNLYKEVVDSPFSEGRG